MANDVINPWQTFRDDRGKPLAVGRLRIYENLTTTIGTAFSDSDLKVPQLVDPYVLDDYGRVTGDLRWSGERSVEVFDSSDAFIRRLDNVVTLVDTTGFAINFESVAAMAADATLEAGDVCQTQSYNSGQRQGGARYIVTASAEAVDNYRVIDLTPAGLQARLLDEEKNKSFFVAGAVGDGVADDSIPVNAVLAVGGNIECADGSFRCAGLTLGAAARIHGNGSLILEQFSTQDLLNLSGSDLFIWFDGITFDGDAANQLAESSADLVSSTVAATTGNISVISFTNCSFLDPTLYAVHGDGADDGQSVLYSFGTCRFLGGLEATATPYTPAYVSLTDGVSGMLEDCYFDLETTPAATGGRAGIITSNATFLNPGYLSVSDCTFNRIGASSDASSSRGAIHAREIMQLMLADNRILTPHYAGIVWGAEVDSVKVNGNLVDSFGASTEQLGQLVSLLTTAAAPGNSWQIEDNQLLASAVGAVVLNGASAGLDAADISLIGNMIDAPAGRAIFAENLDGLDVRGNFINMESVLAVNALELGGAGVSGAVAIEGNTILNVDGVAVELLNGATARYKVDSNTIENVSNGSGIDVDNCDTAIITNNAMDEVATKLIVLGLSINAALIDGNSYVGTAPSTYVSAAGVTNLLYGSNFLQEIDPSIRDLASATAIDITSHYHNITGTTTIDTLNFVGAVQGWVVTLVGSDGNTRTISDGVGNLALAGNMSLGPDDTLTLVYDGAGGWNEVSRSTN